MNKKLLNILGALLGAVCIVLYITGGFIRRFNDISLAVSTSEGTVIVSSNISAISLYLKENDRLKGEIATEHIQELKNDELRTYVPISVCEDSGKIYYISSYTDPENTVPVYEVSIADFSRGKLLPVFSAVQNELIELIEAQRDGADVTAGSIKVRVENGEVCFFVSALDEMYNEKLYKLKFSGGSETVADDKFPDLINSEDFILLGNTIAQLGYYGDLIVDGKRMDGAYKGLFPYGDGTLISCNAKENEYYIINADGEQQSCPDIRRTLDINGIKEKDILSFYSENGAPVIVADGSALVNTVSGVRTEFLYADSIPVLIFKCIGLAAAGFAAVWIIGLAIFGIKVSGKSILRFAGNSVVALFVFNLVVCALGMFMLLYQQASHMVSSLEVISQQYGAMHITDGIEELNVTDENSEDYANSVKALMILSSLEYFNQSNTDFPFSADYYSYSSKAGGYISWLDAGWEDSAALAEECIPELMLDELERSLSDGKQHTDSISTGNGVIVYMISPVKSPSGRITGFYLFSSVSPEAQYRSIKLIIMLMMYQLALTAAVIIAAIISAAAYLRGLEKLRKKASDFVDRGYSPAFGKSKRKDGVSNEITIISNEFDELVADVNANNAEMMNFRVMNRAYFSDAILKLLGKKNISAVNFTEHACENMYSLIALLPRDYCEFEKMNDLLAKLSVKLSEFNAFINETSGSVLQIYSQNAKSINILFFLKEYDTRIKTAFDKSYLNAGGLKMGERRSFDVTFEDAEREKILVGTMLNTCSGTAVTERALDENEYEFTKIPIGMADNEFIYDIIKEHFSNAVCGYLKRGVELYFDGSFTASREMFVRVLKLKADSSAARYYINQIDNNE